MPTTCQIVISGEARAWYAGVPLGEYFLNAEAAYEVAVRSQEMVRERFGLEIGPALMGFSYGGQLCLGADVEFLDNGNPMIHPCLDRLEDFRAWESRHPFDHPLMRQFVEIWREVDGRLGGGKVELSFGNEAPFTAALLLRGPEFLIDIEEKPRLAREFLDFLTGHWLTCHRACCDLKGTPFTRSSIWLADDFSGFLRPEAFRELILPSYRRIYAATQASYRVLHSELLRPEHLPLLGGEVDYLDPHVDQYLTVDDMREGLPAGMDWEWRIITSHLNINTPAELRAEYEEGVRGGAPNIKAVVMPEAPDENVRAIIEVGKRYDKVD